MNTEPTTPRVTGANGDAPARRAHRRRRRRHRLPPMSVMPTLITLGNLVAGFTAIHYAAKPIEFSGPWAWSSLTVAGALIFLGMFLDAIDGSVARLTHSHSELGAQLDSLADLVTFGVAPAFMMARLVSHYIGPEGQAVILGPEADSAIGKILWGIAAVYVSCAALRLARFNVESPEGAEEHLVFRGLPTPGAAGAVVSLIVLHQHALANRGLTLAEVSEVSHTLARWTAFGIPFITILCAIAMVSGIPYVHFMNRYVSGGRSFAYVVRLVIPLLFAVWWFQEVMAIAFTFYALQGPMRLLLGKRRSTPTPDAETDTG